MENDGKPDKYDAENDRYGAPLPSFFKRRTRKQKAYHECEYP